MLLSKMLKKENNNFDIIRLLAAMMVIYGHSYAISPQEGKSDFVLNIINFDYSGSLAVKIFFFLSGLVVSNSLLKNKSISSFIFSRMFRILPGLILVVTISTFLIGPLLSTDSISSYYSNGDTYEYFYKNIVLHPQWLLPGVFDSNVRTAVNGSLWTLPYEALAYTLTLITFVIIGFENRKLATLIAFIVILDPFIGNKLIFSWINAENTEVSLLAPCFSLGVLFSMWKDQISINKKLVFSLWILYYTLHNSPHAAIFFYPAIFTTLLYISSTQALLKLKLPVDISYGVYLWGWPVQQIFAQLYPSSGVLLNQLLSMLVSVLLGTISWFLVEKKFISIGKKTAVSYSEKLDN
ncbi:acyltransferase family protein [Serratia proteamaculans]|uniref:acyltransferase family protein n=1 Tax=Serratia proteamaculans TaxID=28151 RepID=UPI00217BE15D|nr:acyltransferase [Serratia proteamaculans]CAI1173426.1 Acyltransferase family [Serratia proteamaculans]